MLGLTRDEGDIRCSVQDPSIVIVVSSPMQRNPDAWVSIGISEEQIS